MVKKGLLTFYPCSYLDINQPAAKTPTMLEASSTALRLEIPRSRIALPLDVGHLVPSMLLEIRQRLP